MSAEAKVGPFKPANDNFERLVRDLFARGGFVAHAGAWLTEVRPGRVVLELPYAHRIGEGDGVFHAAVVGALGESAGCLAAQTLVPAGTRARTLEYKLNLLQPARGLLLRATADVLSIQSGIVVTRADITVLGGDAEGLCAALQSTVVEDAAG